MTEEFWQNRFHWCALAAGFLAAAEGRLKDDRYVQDLAYEFYETGAFRDCVPPRQPQPSQDLEEGSAPSVPPKDSSTV
jgi:hypothetical protein